MREVTLVAVGVTPSMVRSRRGDGRSYPAPAGGGAQWAEIRGQGVVFQGVGRGSAELLWQQS